jgi:hypothetical protein
MGIVVWVMEVGFFLLLVGVGGFQGFVVWAILTALLLLVRLAHARTQLKASDQKLQVEHQPESTPTEQDDPPHLWIHRRGSWQNLPLDFRTMMWGESLMVRRISVTQWEVKHEQDWRRKRIRELQARLARPGVAGPAYEPCSECGTHGVGGPGSDLHRPRCSKYSAPDEAAARARWDDEFDRETSTEELEELQKEPGWKPFPEELVASLEARYQRYLVSGGSRPAM